MAGPPPQPRPSRPAVTLTMGRFDVRSVTKFSFMLGIAVSIVTFVMFMVLYLIVTVSGALDQAGNAGKTIVGENFDVNSIVNPLNLMIVSLVLAVTNTVMMTLTGLLLSLIYNAIARISGGVRMTFFR